MHFVRCMDRAFDADEFLKKLDRGDFDGRLQEEFTKLPPEQLEQVAKLLAERYACLIHSSVHDFNANLKRKHLD